MIDDNRESPTETPETRAREKRRVRRFKRISFGITGVIILTAAVIFAVALLIIFVL
jgi:cell division septal protein FtsQ